MRPIEKFGLAEKRPEKLERRIFMRVTFHVEVDERAEFAGAPQNRTQLRGEVRNGVGRIGRVHLRIERGNFYGNINDREKIGAVTERIAPTFGFMGKMLEKMEATRGVFGRFLFADHGFAEKIDREPDAFFAPLPQRFHDVARIFSGDELARHAGNVPAQNLSADPRDNFRQSNTRPNERRIAVAHVLEIFIEMANDFAAAPKRCEDIDEAEHLHLEMLVPHRERHHPLVKAGLGENRFGIPIDQLEDLLAAVLDLALQRTHGQKLLR